MPFLDTFFAMFRDQMARESRNTRKSLETPNHRNPLGAGWIRRVVNKALKTRTRHSSFRFSRGKIGLGDGKSALRPCDGVETCPDLCQSCFKLCSLSARRALSLKPG